MTLWGDYYDLNNLCDTVSQISESVVLKESSMSDYVLGLNYDIRHAYQDMRESEQFGRDELSRVKYNGVKISWPHFIIQVGLLRLAASFITTNSDQQSNLFRLEKYCGENIKRSVSNDCGCLY